MVKKIGSKPPTKAAGASAVQPTKTIESSKVGQVDQVRSTERQAGARKAAGVGAKISAEIEGQLLQLIDEEAEKMFGNEQGLPAKKKETVKGAVRMAIKAGLIEGEEDKD